MAEFCHYHHHSIIKHISIWQAGQKQSTPLHTVRCIWGTNLVELRKANLINKIFTLDSSGFWIQNLRDKAAHKENPGEHKRIVY